MTQASSRIDVHLTVEEARAVTQALAYAALNDAKARGIELGPIIARIDRAVDLATDEEISERAAEAVLDLIHHDAELRGYARASS